MTYFQFIHEVEVKVKEEVRDDVTVYIHSAVKNNGTKRHGLTIAQKGINIFPRSEERRVGKECAA